MWQREGTIKGERNQASRVWLLLLLLSGCFDTSIWIFTKPQTLYFSCLGAPWVGSISWMYSVVCFSHKHVSRPIWRTLSYCDFIYLTATRQTTTSSPWTWYQGKHGSQPFGSKLRGWDNSLAWCESLPVYLVYLCHPTKCGPVTYTSLPKSIRDHCDIILWHHDWLFYSFDGKTTVHVQRKCHSLSVHLPASLPKSLVTITTPELHHLFLVPNFVPLTYIHAW